MRVRFIFITICLLISACGGGADGPLNSQPFPPFSDDQTQFLEANAARESVTVTASGLQYEVLREAMGANPTVQSIVTVHYVGNLINGTEFDSSYSRGEPSTFQLSGTIDGWVEGLQLMSVGSEYRFVIPSELAYGEAGAGTAIGPNEALIFVVDLLEINTN